jgi:3-mercaptopyruvate sulfurtransferase SseA
VLEWRADPESGWTNPHLGSFEREVVVFCAHGFSSSFAAATLRELGYAGATDLEGGFDAWVAAGLPVVAATEPDDEAAPGMGGPEVGADVTTAPNAGRRAGFD